MTDRICVGHIVKRGAIAFLSDERLALFFLEIRTMQAFYYFYC